MAGVRGLTDLLVVREWAEDPARLLAATRQQFTYGPGDDPGMDRPISDSAHPPIV
jgi:hypothetical protein